MLEKVPSALGSVLYSTGLRLYLPILCYILVTLTSLYRMTDGYSASDLKALASDASLGPIRG